MQNYEFKPEAGPIYKQVYTLILDKIKSGEWAPGEQLPPETLLCKDLSVSRHTIRKAMNLLTTEGYLYRQPGKGTFVNKSKSNYQLSYLYSFSEQMKALGKVPTSRVIHIETNIIPNEVLQERLALSTHERLTKIHRLRIADNEPMSLEEVYINSNLAPKLENKDLKNNSLYTILENEYDLTIKDGDMILGAQQATKDQAKLLNIEQDSPVVYMDCLTYLHNQRPAFLTYARYPYDRYVFSLNLPRKDKQ